jgi:hypothetical protein
MHGFVSEAFVILARLSLSGLGDVMSVKVEFSKMSGHLRS